MYHTYVLRSLVNGRHYYGHAEDVAKRLKVHNRGKVRSTKNGVPWEVIYVETFPTRSEAYRQELFFKSPPGWHYLKEKGILGG